MTPTVRRARSDDLEAVLALLRQLHPTDPEVEGERLRRVFGAILTSEDNHLLVLETEGRVVATAYLNVVPNLTRSASPYAVVENVIVDERLRGTGLGKLLLQGVLDRAWRAGCYKAMLMTGSRREATHAFYRACGFSGDDKVGYVARTPAV